MVRTGGSPGSLWLEQGQGHLGASTCPQVVYFTSLFPYCVLVVLAARGLTLPGAYQGVQYYLRCWQGSHQTNPLTWIATVHHFTKPSLTTSGRTLASCWIQRSGWTLLHR